MNANHKKPENTPIPGQVLEKLDQPTRAEFMDIWKQAARPGSPDFDVSDNEMETALHAVHQKIGKSARPRRNAIWFINRYAAYAAAALVLIALPAFFIFVPKTIHVPHGKMATVEFPDGSVAEMNSGTTLRYNRLYKFTNRNIQLNGEAFFSVEKDPEPFIVQANGAVIEVTGTRFNVRSRFDGSSPETRVTVTEGQVLLYPENQKEHRVSLRKGQESQWQPGFAAPLPAGDIEIADAAPWRDQRFVFREQPLGTIIKELERRFNVPIDFTTDNRLIVSEPLTAYYSRQTRLESILDDICTVKGLRYTKTANGYRIFE